MAGYELRRGMLCPPPSAANSHLGLMRLPTAAKHSSDAAAREQLEKVVEVLVAGGCVGGGWAVL